MVVWSVACTEEVHRVISLDVRWAKLKSSNRPPYPSNFGHKAPKLNLDLLSFFSSDRPPAVVSFSSTASDSTRGRSRVVIAGATRNGVLCCGMRGYPRCASFAKQPLQNEDKLRHLFQGRRATGEQSVSAVMMSKSSEAPKRADVVLVDTEEGSGDSGEMHSHDQGNMDISVGNESRSSPQSLQTTETGKRKGDGDYDGYKRRRNQKIDKCLDVLKKIMSCEVQSSTPPAPPPPPPPPPQKSP
ncbi:hypothetical protein Cgig2_009720 [Carnegiea gigantea]|uniref:Uncharacterized protein n=1 Tax=Carnegiea gigantea TaxID=171969 RepID=A0A9Q1K5F6_9CARY|nr:hypothetical protein Cgig2_009720 [Carnegiea gigantea]